MRNEAIFAESRLRCTSRSATIPLQAPRQVCVEPLRPTTDPGEIGGIRLRGRLGQGGMGIVYYGITQDGEPVAVKMISAEHLEKPEALARFEREAIAMEMVQGPRVANLLMASEPGENPPWFAAEYVQGLNLAEFVVECGPLAVDLGAALGIGVAEALAEIHLAGILHRDLKPANILLGQDGPRVIDFGLAALIQAPGTLTRTGEMLGTPVCMSPEQARHEEELTPAADVYSLGAVLAFALTGRYPYVRPTAPATLLAITDPSKPPDLGGIPDLLLETIAAMLAHSPAARPTVADVTGQLTKALAEAGHGDPGTARRRLAEATYRERPNDPGPPQPPAARPPRIPKNPRVPSALVAQLAERMRADYARDARF